MAWPRRKATTALMLAALPLWTACAPVLLAGEPQWEETNHLTFAYPVGQVYAMLAQEVERSGRKIVERDGPSYSLVVSYPLSWLKNNWGGTLKLACSPSEFGTTVTIRGDRRSGLLQIRAMGDEVLEDVDRALRRQPRTL